MNITPLKIDLIRQDPDSDDCLRACALMVFKYFKEPITKEEIWGKLHVYKKHSGLYGGYLSDLGSLAIKKGYQTIIHHYATHTWDKDTIEAANKGKQALKKKMNELKKAKRWPVRKLYSKSINYLELGGKYKIIFPTLDNLDKYLTQRIPVILSVRAENFYQNPKASYPHYILVIGKKEGKYIIRDPYLAVNKKDGNELLYAWMRHGGWMMVILPKKKKEEPPTVRQTKLRF